MKICFVCQLRYVGSKRQEKNIHFFKTPVNKLSAWRTKLNADNLTERSHVCSQHFEENNINKFNRLGEEYWRLSANAEPTLLLCSNSTKLNKTSNYNNFRLKTFHRKLIKQQFQTDLHNTNLTPTTLCEKPLINELISLKI